MHKYTSEQQAIAFWNKVNKNGSIPKHRPELGNCWEWTASLVKGYGAFKVYGVYKRAHRISWAMSQGEIPDDVQILHKCDNRKCVRLDHLFSGNNQDNIDDKVAKNRQSHCPGEDNGRHKLTISEVIYIRQWYNSGKVTLKHIGKEYGVSTSLIHKIVKRLLWKDVP